MLVVLAVIYAGYVFLVKKVVNEGVQVDTQSNNSPVYYKDLLRVDSPLPGSKVNNSIIIRGAARGNWYFEASFPVQVVDAEGRVLAQGIAEAQSNWMTTDYVPFIANLQIGKILIAPGAPLRIILTKDNPSGLPENDDSTSFGVIYSNTVAE